MELARALAGVAHACCCWTKRWPGSGARNATTCSTCCCGCAPGGHHRRHHRAHHARDDADRRSFPVVLDHGRVLASGLPRRWWRTAPSSRPTSARNGRPARMLEVNNLSVAYGGLRALTDVITVGAGRDNSSPLSARTAPASRRCSRLFPASCPRPAGRSLSWAKTCSRFPPPRRAHLGIAHVPEGRQVFKTLTVRENLEMGAYPKAGRDAWHHTLDRIHTLFPILANARPNWPARFRAASSRWWRSAGASRARPGC